MTNFNVLVFSPQKYDMPPNATNPTPLINTPSITDAVPAASPSQGAVTTVTKALPKQLQATALPVTAAASPLKVVHTAPTIIRMASPGITTMAAQGSPATPGQLVRAGPNVVRVRAPAAGQQTIKVNNQPSLQPQVCTVGLVKFF